MAITATTLVIHACGGAPTNILKKIRKNLLPYGEKNAFTELKIRYIDTTTSSVKDIPLTVNEEVFTIEEHKSSKPDLDGSGGLRGYNAESIKIGIKKYIDQYSLHQPVTGEYHLVLTALSGGSGSVIAKDVVEGLVLAGATFTVFGIGEEAEHQRALNTYSTLVTLQNIAMRNKTGVTLAYFNNELRKSGSVASIKEDVDRSVLEKIKDVMAFLSATVDNIDATDRKGLFNPGFYTDRLGLPSGLYGLIMARNQILTTDYENTLPAVARTIYISKDEVPVINPEYVNTKHGFFTDPDAVSEVGTGPLCLATYYGVFNRIIDSLKQNIAEREKQIKDAASNTTYKTEADDTLEDIY